MSHIPLHSLNSLLQEPLHLSCCVISSESETQDMFEIHEHTTKEALLCKVSLLPASSIPIPLSQILNSHLKPLAIRASMQSREDELREEARQKAHFSSKKYVATRAG